jgi:hypothetical protein
MRQSLNLPKRKWLPLSGDGFATKFSVPRSEKKREIYKLILAQSDIGAAFRTCEHFLTVIGPHAAKSRGRYAGMDHPLYYPLLEAIVISYARPFTPNDKLGQLKKKWGEFGDARFQEAHDKILRARNELVAHSDPFERKVQIKPPGAGKLGAIHSPELGFSICGYWFTVRDVDAFYHTAGDLATRLLAEVEKLLADLYAGMKLPARAFDLRLNEGL